VDLQEQRAPDATHGARSGTTGVKSREEVWARDTSGTHIDSSTEGATMAVDRDELVKHLRSEGKHDKADKAERELPKHVSKDEHKGLLDKLGIDDSIVDKIPDSMVDKIPGGDKLKDIL
jgi:type II secretory pathway component PulK